MMTEVTKAEFEQECNRRAPYETSLDTVVEPPRRLFHSAGDVYPFCTAFGCKTAEKFYLDLSDGQLETDERQMTEMGR